MNSDTQSTKNWTIYCCPYGPRTDFTLVPCILGYILFNVAAWGCNSFLIQNNYSYYTEADQTYYGYWGVQDPENGSCNHYARDNLDGVLITGRAIGIMGAVIGAVFIILLLTTIFLTIPRPTRLVLGIVPGVIMPLFCCIMFIGLATKKCTIEESYYEIRCLPTVRGFLLVPAILLWIGGSIPLFFCFKNPRPNVPRTMDQVMPVSSNTNQSTNNVEIPGDHDPKKCIVESKA